MKYLNYPTSVQIELTESCNHKCFYCYNSWQLNKSKDAYMTKENSIVLSNLLYTDIKPFQITLTGGEPLLNMPALLIFSEKLNKQSIHFSINSNLSLFNNDNLEKLLHVSDNFGILTSLPHYKKEQYEFITNTKNLEVFYSNLNNLVKIKNIPVGINMVVNKNTLKDVYDEAKFLYENYGIKSFAATPVTPPTNTPYEYHKLTLSNEETIRLCYTLIDINKDFGMKVDILEALPKCFLPEDLINNETLNMKKRSCSAGRSGITIDYKGNVRSCSHDTAHYGNIFENKFSDIWKVLEPFRLNEFVSEECLPCEELDSCNGGCRLYTLKENNVSNKKDSRMIGPIKIKKPVIKNSLQIEEFQKYFIKKSILFREEDKQVYTFFNGYSETIFVNNSFKEFINTLKNTESFNLNDLTKIYGKENEEQLKSMLNLLFNKKFLLKSNI
ncbi:MAG: radical SAM protein [Candidatus Nanoarchaeia archaeon]|nr:radical SAM protein [Candidatus Nanoarchaeia archaeon]